MKELLNLLKKWEVKVMRLFRPDYENSNGKITFKRKNKEATAEEIAFEQERVVLPEQYYVTRTGQTMRKPVRFKKKYKRYWFEENNR